MKNNISAQLLASGWADKLYMNEVRLLKKLISIDSQCRKSNKKVVDFIVSLFPARNCKITRLMKDGKDFYNIEVKFKGEKSNRPLIFSGHTDTVPASSKWTRNPFKPAVENGKIFGLGASDMKAGLACMIMAALSIKKKFKQDVIFLFDADEEASGAGGTDFIKRLAIKPGCAKVIVCEPSDMKLQIGQKGVLEFKVTVCGKSFHSSRTSFKKNLQFNAILKAFQIFKALEKEEKRIEKNKDGLFGAGTQAICQVQGGTAANVIPDSCSFVVNRRVLPKEDIKQIIRRTERLIKFVEPAVKVEVEFSGEPNLINKNGELFKLASFVSKVALGRVKVDITPGWTQAGLFKKWGECLIWGPGALGMAHQADEYCLVENLNKMSQCYKKLIELNQ